MPPGWKAAFSSEPACKGKGKGVAILAREAVLRESQLRIVYDKSSRALDILAVSVRGILFVNVYLHSKIAASKLQSVYGNLLDHLDEIPGTYEATVLTGDFNHPRHSHRLIDLLAAVGFIPACHPSEPTHAAGGKLDWVLVRGLCELPKVYLQRQPEDHHAFVFRIPSSQAPPPRGKVLKYQQLDTWPDGTRARFNGDLLRAAKASQVVSDLQDRLPDFLEQRLGSRSRPSGRLPKPWYNKDICAKRKVVKKVGKLLRRCKDEEALEVQPAPKAYLQAAIEEATVEFRAAKRDLKKAINSSKRRALRSICVKIEGKTATVRSLARGKKGAAHQSGVVANPERAREYWSQVFADEDPLPEPPRGPQVTTEQQLDPDCTLFSRSQTALKQKVAEGIQRAREAMDAVASAGLFTPEDVTRAITSLGNKAPGADGIRISIFRGRNPMPKNPDAERIKQKGQKKQPRRKKTRELEDKKDYVTVLAPELCRLYNVFCQYEIPRWAKAGLGHLLWKKGSRMDPANYRLIVLQPIITKIYERMIDLRLRDLISEGVVNVSVEQGGFMESRSTYDSIFLLLSLKDVAQAKDHPLYTAFLDVRRAFDSVNHRKLLHVLKAQGVPDHWIGVIHGVLNDRVTQLGDGEIKIERGTPQGSPLSPLLFILFINPLIERLRDVAFGVELAPQAWIRALLFADDICLTCSNLPDLQRALDECTFWASEMGMSFNASKSHLLALRGQPDARARLTLSDEALEWKREVTYLGVQIAKTSSAATRATMDAASAWKAYGRIKAAMDASLPLPLDVQLNLIETDILAKVLYPAAVQDLDYATIDRFVNRLLRKLTNVPWHTSATLLRCELGVQPTVYAAHKRVLMFWWHIHHDSWFCHLLGAFHGRSQYERLRKVVAQYGFDSSIPPQKTKTIAATRGGIQEVDFTPELWKAAVYAKVAIRAAEQLQAQADDPSRRYPGPEPPQPNRDKQGLLRLAPRCFVKQERHMGRFGIQYRQAKLQGTRAPWTKKPPQRCTFCLAPDSRMDILHSLQCQHPPPDFATLKRRVLSELGVDRSHLLHQGAFDEMDKVPRYMAFILLRKAHHVYQQARPGSTPVPRAPILPGQPGHLAALDLIEED